MHTAEIVQNTEVQTENLSQCKNCTQPQRNSSAQRNA